MNWKSAEYVKPPPHEVVLLAIASGDYAVGHYAGKTNEWVGFAGNQSPPFYVIETGLVTHWCLIEPPPR